MPKKDASRDTFNASKHYRHVYQQQGRVQLDADWNEQSDIFIHRVETEAADIIGLCGGPLHNAAFHILSSIGQLTDEDQKLPENNVPPPVFSPPNFLISAGHYYVDGILCENDLLTTYLSQPDLPDAPPLEAAGLYLIYVDVWQRHLTALQDPSIREIALVGPDTATRMKTVWQVRHFFAGASATGNCLTSFTGYETLIAPSSGKLSARAQKESISADPCIVPPGAGYRGLQNQLYRVEIHQGGTALDATSGGAGTLATRVPNHNDQIKVTGGSWAAGQAVEIFSSKVGSDPMNGTLAYITHFDSGSKTLTLNINVSKITLDELRVRAVNATYTWSRDNGVVTTTIKNINGAEITVHDLGPDVVLGFKEGQWVELTDDKLDLHGIPGQLAQIIKIDPAIKLITLNFAPAPLSSHAGGVDPARNPLLRRWDGVDTVKFHPNVTEEHFLDLESGVQVRFFAGTYKTGDYWTIPARTATADAQSGNIEWPQAGGSPLSLSPSGIQHHYCRLAMMHWNGSTFDVVEDCRNLFPPITELTSLFYVNGAGQEAMPNDPLPQLLQVGVFNGRWPVAGAHVSFITPDNGRLALNAAGLGAATNELHVTTGSNGIASCAWLLEPNVNKPSQQVEARLRNANNKALPPVVRFNGNLSIADQVFYDPGTCGTLQTQKTVQKALSRLTQLGSLNKLSGDGQPIIPGETLAPLRVLVANSCGPITDQQVKVNFQVVPPGTGTVSNGVMPDANSIVITADPNGVATCQWKPDPTNRFQEVEATLLADTAHPIVPPTSVRFSATLNIQHGGCEVVVGEGGEFERLDEAIQTLIEGEHLNICICLLPGIHNLPEGLNVIAEVSSLRIKIQGCGRASRIVLGEESKIAFLSSFTLRDVEVFTQSGIFFDRCNDLDFEDCYLIQENLAKPFITISHARHIQFEDNIVIATLPLATNPSSPIQVFEGSARNISELYALPDRFEFEQKLPEVVTELARQSTAKRIAIVRKLDQTIPEIETLTAVELISYQNFSETISEPTVNVLLLQERLADLRVASLSAAPGVALVLTDAEADTRIEDNDITGTVSLYGPPSRARLSEDEMRRIAAGLRQGAIRFTNSLANLQVRDNILYRMDVSEAIIALLRSSGPTNVTLNRLYRRCFFTDNVFRDGNSIFVMEHLSLVSSSFESNMGAGVVVANAAIYTGNYALDNSLFIVAGRGLRKDLNLISVIEF